MAQRMNADERKGNLLSAGIAVAMKVGYKSVTRDEVAAQAKVSSCLVTRYFGDMDNLRTEIVKQGAKNGNLKIIAEGLVHKHPAAKKAGAQYREEIIDLLFK